MANLGSELQRRFWQQKRQMRRRLELLSGFLNVHLETNSAYTNTVLLAGSARSGTTWATNVINYDNGYRFMCEPFMWDQVWLSRHFKNLQYLPPENDDPKYLEPARSIFSGKVRDAWIDRRNHRMFVQNRLVKHGRGGLLLGWMHHHFPGMPIVFLMRHPLAVVNSRLQLGWKRDVRNLLSQEDLMRDHLRPFQSALEKADGEWEHALFYWCVENYVPLQQIRPGDVYVLFYEMLCVDPHSEVERLFSYLEKKFDDRVYARMKMPSVQARVGISGDKSAVLAGQSLIDGWRKHVNKEQLRRAVEILSLFGLDRIYGEESVPHAGAANAPSNGVSLPLIPA